MVKQCSPKYEKQRRHRVRKRYKAFLYLKEHPCVDCGEPDPVVLEFDHVRGQKLFAISSELSATRYTWEKVLDEIAKCDVRCANCHRRRHAAENGWYDFSEIFEPVPDG